MRKIAVLLAFFVLLALSLSVVLHSILGFFLAIPIVIGGPLGYARLTGRSRRPSNGLYWRGYVSFRESSLTNHDLFPNIEFRERAGGWGRKGLSSGSCEIRNTGIHWLSSGWATPHTEASGSFVLPWSAVPAAEATRIPGKFPGLGGRIELSLSDERGVLEGEFLGSLKGLAQALEASSHAGGLGRRRRERPAT
jgi:hypothetical protein